MRWLAYLAACVVAMVAAWIASLIVVGIVFDIAGVVLVAVLKPSVLDLLTEHGGNVVYAGGAALAVNIAWSVFIDTRKPAKDARAWVLLVTAGVVLALTYGAPSVLVRAAPDFTDWLLDLPRFASVAVLGVLFGLATGLAHAALQAIDATMDPPGASAESLATSVPASPPLTKPAGTPQDEFFAHMASHGYGRIGIDEQLVVIREYAPTCERCRQSLDLWERAEAVKAERSRT